VQEFFTNPAVIPFRLVAAGRLNLGPQAPQHLWDTLKRMLYVGETASDVANPDIFFHAGL
jgi:hypothetical protein